MISSNLTERKQFTQIDDKRSPLARVYYRVPQGSILGPILLNLCVHDLSENSFGECLRFADDTTLYHYCKVNYIITENAKLLEANINSLESWSKKSNLVFKKQYFFQLDRCHKNTILVTQHYTPSSGKTLSLKENFLKKFWECNFIKIVTGKTKLLHW